MGVVYACKHKTLEDKQYALKVLEPKYARMTSLRSRFLSEGKIQAKLTHPHIVKVIDVIDNEKEGGSSSFLAIVMEYVRGKSLDQLLEERGPLSVQEAVSTTLVVLDAIGYAHHNGIVHRDMKPSNVMISDELSKQALYNGVKVMDFGIAKLLDSEAQSYTMTGSTIGTPLYMPPEQIETPKLIDKRADLYAIGTMLYELLCGRTPFAEFKEFDLFRAQLNLKPPSIKNFNREVPDKLEAIIMKSLEKNREDRYPDAEAFQRALLSTSEYGEYDNIQLYLNPNDGIIIPHSNSLFQKKIQKKFSKTETEKTPEKVQQNKVIVSGINDALKQVSFVDNHKLKSESTSKARRAPIEEASREEIDVKKIESDAENRQAETSASIVESNQVTSVKKSRASKAVSVNGADEVTNKPAKRATKASRVEADEREEKTRSSKSTSSERPAEKSATSVRKAKKADSKAAEESVQNASANAKAASASTKPERKRSSESNRKTNAKVSVNQREKMETVNEMASVGTAAKRIRLAMVIVVLLLLILVAGSLAYRNDKNMPKAITKAPEETSAIEQDQVIVPEDLSTIRVEQIDTPTGKMTLIPTARHQVSSKQGDVELKAFYIDQTEVSYYQYQKCVADNVCAPLQELDPTVSANLPVTNIGFAAAQKYCEYVGKTLPTLEQWEAAAKFGQHDEVDYTKEKMKCFIIQHGATSDCQKVIPNQPASIYSHANGSNYGRLRNMLGNVREWVNTSDKTHKKMATKGGSYKSKTAELQISATVFQPTNQGADDLGFRCIKQNL